MAKPIWPSMAQRGRAKVDSPMNRWPIKLATAGFRDRVFLATRSAIRTRGAP
jgi:hypothetical protein